MKAKARPRNAKTSLLLFGCALFLLVPQIWAVAQSGRKIPKRTEPPPTVQPSEPEPLPTPSSKQQKGSLSVIVSPDSSMLIGYQDLYSRTVVHSCVERLRGAFIKDASAGKEMNRKEARDLAKKITDTYVAWVEMASDETGARTDPRSTDPRQLYFNYVLFAPQTGSTKSSGRVYLTRTAQVGRGGIGLPLPIPTGPGTTEYMCRRAGEELADRILSALNLPLPPKIAN